MIQDTGFRLIYGVVEAFFIKIHSRACDWGVIWKLPGQWGRRRE